MDLGIQVRGVVSVSPGRTRRLRREWVPDLRGRDCQSQRPSRDGCPTEKRTDRRRPSEEEDLGSHPDGKSNPSREGKDREVETTTYKV